MAWHVEADLRERGLAHIRGPLDAAAYRDLARSLGDIVGAELIALRPGAHAYVAKPGPVPLHTDHPEVDVIGWWCERQDEADGASLLFDARPVLDALPEEDRVLLRQVELWCPPLRGGPPTLRFPVLRATPDGDALFCSPWLKSANAIPAHEAALGAFREKLSVAARRSTNSVRLEAGSALFVDNTRVLHGRAAIFERSQRRLHRLWLARRRTDGRDGPAGPPSSRAQTRW